MLLWTPLVSLKLLIQCAAHRRKGIESFVPLHTHVFGKQPLDSLQLVTWKHLLLLPEKAKAPEFFMRTDNHFLLSKIIFWPIRNWTQGTIPGHRASSPRNKFSNSWSVHLQTFSLLECLYDIKSTILNSTHIVHDIELTCVFVLQGFIDIIYVM